MKFILSALLPLYVSAFAPSSLSTIPSTQQQQQQQQQQHDIPTTTSIKAAMMTTEENEIMTTAELPQKLYFPKEKEIPKVLGGMKIGLRRLTVITGASSGLGLSTATTLVNTGRHFVVMACRDVEKGKRGESFCCSYNS